MQSQWKITLSRIGTCLFVGKLLVNSIIAIFPQFLHRFFLYSGQKPCYTDGTKPSPAGPGRQGKELMMENKNSKIDQILAHLAEAASVAASAATDAVQSAGNVVGDKYNSVKVTLELNRLQDEQSKLFCDIGRTMFLIQTGAFVDEPKTEAGEVIDAQETVDRLLALASDKQQEIDAAAQRLTELSGDRVCAVCGTISTNPRDKFCANCGAKLPEPPPPTPEETPDDSQPSDE